MPAARLTIRLRLHTKRLLVICISILLFSAIKAKASAIPDSLLAKLQTAKSTDEKTDTYFSILRLLDETDEDFDKYRKDMLAYCQRKASDYCIANLNLDLGYKAFLAQDMKLCDSLTSVALNVFDENNKYGKVVTTSNLRSIMYERLGDFDQALLVTSKTYLQLKDKADDSTLAQLYQRLGKLYAYAKGDMEESINFFNKAETILAEKGGATYASLLYDKGGVLATTDPVLAEKTLLLADSIAQQIDDTSLRSYINHSLTYINHNRGDLQKAIELTIKGITYAEEVGDNRQVANLYISLADLYRNINSTEKAKEYFHKALGMPGSTDDPILKASAYASLGLMSTDSVSTRYLEMANTLTDSLDIEYLQQQVLPALASRYFDQGQMEEGKALLDQFVGLTANAGGYYSDEVSGGLGRYYLYNGDYVKAIKSFNLAYEVAKEYHNIFGQKLYAGLLADAYSKTKQYKKAYEWSNVNQDLIDSLNILQNQEYITEIKLTTEFEKEKALTALKTEKEQAVLRERQKRTAWLGGGAALGLAIMLLLYRSIKKKNEQIETQNHQLQELNNTKDTLFQIIGHDLKKPTIGFRNISSNINYLLKNKDYDRLQALGEEVDQDAKSLYMLTDNLLNWATVQKDAITLRPQKVDVHQVVQENVTLFSNVAKRKGIQLINEVSPKTMAQVDRNSIDTVIRNLVDNAIKYTDSGGTVTIESRKRNDLVTINIKDTGQGVSPALYDQLQSDAAISSQVGTQGEQGSGIGLKLVSRLIRKNAGTFTLGDNDGLGTMASISLPLAS